MITIEFDNTRVTAALKRLIRAGANPTPVLKVVGEHLVESTLQRIRAGGPGPNGEIWEKNSPAYLFYMTLFGQAASLWARGLSH